MATGSGNLGANEPSAGTSNITPTYEVPSEAGLYQSMGASLAKLSGVAQDAIDRRAARKGAKAGMEAAEQNAVDGTKVAVPMSNPLNHGAYAEAFKTAAGARMKDEIDARDAQLRGQYQYDPEGYKRESGKVLSGYIQGAPEQLAVELEQYGQKRFGNGYEGITQLAAQRSTQEAAQAIGVRIKGLDETLGGLASSGKIGSPEYQAAVDERHTLQDQREKNQAILYSPEQRAYDDERFLDGLQATAITHSAVQEYGTAGGGLPGQAAALRFLDKEILNGDAFKDLPPDRVHRLYTDAKKQLTDFTADDVAQRRAEEGAERDKRAAQRDAAGDLRLGIMMGDVGEKDIMARTDIDDGTKATLVAASRAQARRDASEGRAAATASRVEAGNTYREYSDKAAAGDLSSDELADAQASKILTPGQVRTLAAKRDKSLKPVVDDVMAPVLDMKRAGRELPRAKVAIAEDAATQWARQNPNANLTEKLAAGEAIGKRVFGARKPAAAVGGSTRDAGRAARTTALKQQFAAKQIDRATYQKQLRALADGN